MLLLGGDSDDAGSLRDTLRRDSARATAGPLRLPNLELVACPDLGAGIARLQSGGIEAILVIATRTDIPPETVGILHRLSGGVPVIALVPDEDASFANRALEAGAVECLSRADLQSTAVAHAIRHAIERRGIEAVIARSEARAREAEESLYRAEKLAALGELVSGVAHELNNPLSSIMLFAETMLEEPRSDGDVEALTMIRDQARRSRAVVRDLLGYVRGQQGEREMADVTAAIRSALGSLRGEGARLGVRFQTRISPDLPSMVIDRAAIEQVLTNLILNAAQAAGAGGTVGVSARRSGGGCAIVVEDDGPGIPGELMPCIFEPFFTTKAAGEGTGLGLPMSLAIARRHGGELRAENRAASEGRGARFTLVLPEVGDGADPAQPSPASHGASAKRASPSGRAVPGRGVAEATASEAPREAADSGDSAPVAEAGSTREAGGSPAAGSGSASPSPAMARPEPPASSAPPRILVIDDEATIRGAIRRFFTRRHWQVDEAADGATGLEILLGESGGSYDVVISDIRLPRLTGIELHDRLAAERPELLDRLILATGDTGAPPAAALAQRATCPILQKPFELAMLARAVEEIRSRSG